MLSYDEETALLGALPERYRTVVQLGLECGARVQSQLLPLTWQDVDCDRARLRLYAGNAKNRKELWIPLSDGMVTRLRGMKEASTSPLVFAARRGGTLKHSIKKRFPQARRAAGLGTDVTIHGLRHTFATRFYEAPGDLLLLQKLGGWSSLTQVQRYAHARIERGAKAIRRMVAASESGRESHSKSHSAVAVVR